MNAMKKWDNVTIIDTPTIIDINQDNFYTMSCTKWTFSQALDTVDSVDWHHSTLYLLIKNFMVVKWVLLFHLMVINGTNHFL